MTMNSLPYFTLFKTISYEDGGYEVKCECDGRFNDIAQCRFDQRYFQNTINLDF